MRFEMFGRAIEDEEVLEDLNTLILFCRCNESYDRYENSLSEFEAQLLAEVKNAPIKPDKKGS